MAETAVTVAETVRERCRLAIEHQGIYRCRPGETLPAKQPGRRYTWCFYLRRCLYDVDFADSVARLLLECRGLDGLQIGACEDAGVPLAIALSARSGRPMFTVKKAPKAYALGNRTEGRVRDMPVLLVDDLAGSQSTLRRAEHLLLSAGVEVAPWYLALVHKSVNTHAENYLQRELVTLFDCSDFRLSWDAYQAGHGREPDFGRWI